MKNSDITMVAFQNSMEAKAIGLALRDVILKKHPELKDEFNASIEKHLKQLALQHSEELGLKLPLP